MATDANSVLVSLGTVTASGTATALDLKTGTPRRGLKAKVLYSGGTATGGTATVTYTIEHSTDNSTFYLAASGAADAIALTSAGGIAGEFHIPFETSKRYVRTVWTVTGGTSPSIIHQVDITLGRPG
jgi:hypothetical protein